MKRLVLASRSPRRLSLLRSAGFSVEVMPSHIDESAQPDESVVTLVERLSREKAEACSYRGALPIVAADTLVSIDGQQLGQPADLLQAKAMLRMLSGHTHRVMTGVCVRRGAQLRVDHCTTAVQFRRLRDEEIDTYLAHNEILDKAGAYAIQGGAASFIERIDGPLDNVIGLPVQLMEAMLYG